MAKLLTLLFHTFLLKLVFFQKSHSPCRKKKIFEKQQKTKKKNNNKEMAKLLTYDGQVIDPTAYIYMPESSFGTTFLAFQELETVPPF